MQMETTSSEEMNIFDKLESKNLHLIKVDIFSRLDYKSLHVARQVCSGWNLFVLEEFWFSSNRRRMMKKRLLTEWKSAETTKRIYNFPGTKGFYLACDNKTLCMGTRDNQTVLLEPWTGRQIATLDCDTRLTQADNEADTEPPVQDDESRDVQLDMTDSVIVTATGSGVVTVWRREDLGMIYQASHHGKESILGVSVVGDLLVTGGYHGSLAVLTVRTDSVSLEWQEKTHPAISHIHSDGSSVLVGTPVGMSVWDCRERTSPALQSQLNCGQVCCCVLSRPLVVCTGLFVNCGVQIWNFLTGQMLRSPGKHVERQS